MKISQVVSMRIRECLRDKEVSLYRLEINSGLSKGTITSLIYCRYKSVNLSTLITITRTLGYSLSEFFDSPLFNDENLEED